MKDKIILSWSGGKDSALAFDEVQRSKRYEIAALLTTVTNGYDRVSMHGIRRTLLERQAESLGIPLEKVFISKNASQDRYGSRMRDVMVRYMNQGVCSVAFGDLFLEDVREYREDNLSKVGMNAIFPLWKRDTCQLAHTFIDLGFRAVTTCVDSKFLDKSFAGRPFDENFLSSLPPGVDPCGENGEFHSFVYDGPIFQERILHETGEVVLRDNRFYYCDVVPP